MKYKICIMCLMIMIGCKVSNPNQDVLDKLQTIDNSIENELLYDLYLIGNEAQALLIKTLNGDHPRVRLRAISLLESYFGDSRALPALTETFLQDTDEYVRIRAAEAIETIDVEYVKKLMQKHLYADKKTQSIALSMLIGIRDNQIIDEQVIPLLVSQMNNINAPSEIRGRAINTLVDLKDKRVAPILLDRLNDNFPNILKAETVKKLIHIGEESAIPQLLDILDSETGGGLKDLVPQLGHPTVTLLLEELQQTESKNVREWILRAFREARNPELAAVYGKNYLQTDDTELKSAIVTALKNIGAEGFNSLLDIAKQKPDSDVLYALATYHSSAAFDAILAFALDVSSPLRADAIYALTRYGGIRKQEMEKHITRILSDVNPKVKLRVIESLARFGDLWKAEISKHIEQLLTQNNTEVKLKTIDLIQQEHLTTAIPILKRLSQDPEKKIPKPVNYVLDFLLDKPQLKLDLEMSQPHYDYGQSVSLTFRLKNVSNYPITLALLKSLGSSYMKLKIQQPDGTFVKYTGPIPSLAPLGLQDYQTLDPGDEISDTILVSEFYDLYKSGRYTFQLRLFPRGGGFQSFLIPWPYDKGSVRNSKKKVTTWGWPYVIWSPPVHFTIKAPSTEKFDKMLAAINPKHIDQTKRSEAINICNQLGELGKPEAVPALLSLNSFVFVENKNNPLTPVIDASNKALLKFSDPELVPVWIKMLDRKYIYGDFTLQVIERLKTTGDTRAVEPIRRIMFRSNDSSMRANAALALQQLGDDNGIEWIKTFIHRKLRHRNKHQRQSGAHLLYRLQLQKYYRYQKLDIRRDPRFYAENFDRSMNLGTIIEKVLTPAGLKELLKHENPIIQRAAAYDLASLGDNAGVHLIEQDLHANDSATRLQARKILSKLQFE